MTGTKCVRTLLRRNLTEPGNGPPSKYSQVEASRADAKGCHA